MLMFVRDGAELKRAALVAIDLGAESCRVSLLRWHHDSPQIRVVHRFANGPLRREKTLLWNIKGIVQGISEGPARREEALVLNNKGIGQRKREGLCHCRETADEGIASIGVDGWAVD